jgi:hypothetical protein
MLNGVAGAGKLTTLPESALCFEHFMAIAPEDALIGCARGVQTWLPFTAPFLSRARQMC